MRAAVAGVDVTASDAAAGAGVNVTASDAGFFFLRVRTPCGRSVQVINEGKGNTT